MCKATELLLFTATGTGLVRFEGSLSLPHRAVMGLPAHLIPVPCNWIIIYQLMLTFYNILIIPLVWIQWQKWCWEGSRAFRDGLGQLSTRSWLLHRSLLTLRGFVEQTEGGVSVAGRATVVGFPCTANTPAREMEMLIRFSLALSTA